METMDCLPVAHLLYLKTRILHKMTAHLLIILLTHKMTSVLSALKDAKCKGQELVSPPIR